MLDLDVFQGSGDFKQDVLPGDVISVGGSTFTGQDIKVDFDLFRTSLALRAENRFANGFGVDGFFGVGMSELEIELSSPGSSDSDVNTSYGPILGMGLSYAPIDLLRFFVEGSVNPGAGSVTSSVGVTTVDLGSQIKLGPNASAILGWRRIEYEAEYDSSVRSDIELILSGPLVALRFGF